VLENLRSSNDYQSKSKIKFSQEEILEMAVKVVTHPTYGWLTASVIVFGCRPNETFTLIPFSNGTASVINLDKKNKLSSRRKIIAIPTDFVKKLNLFDQVSQPIFFENYIDYDSNKVNKIISEWRKWFKHVNSDLELEELRDSWVNRARNKNISSKLASEYMGLNYKDFQSKYYKVYN